MLLLDEISRLNKPDLTNLGIIKASRMRYADRIWGSSDNTVLPPEESTRESFRQDFGAYNGIVIFDIEHLEHWRSHVTEAQRIINLDIKVTIARWAQEECPLAQISYYGEPPNANPSRARLSSTDSKYQSWATFHSNYEEWAKQLDVYCPSLYPVNTDITDFWSSYAAGYYDVAKNHMSNSTNKDVYGFVSPHYHSVVGQSVPLSEEDFLFMLRRMADIGYRGAILWNVQKTKEWNPDEPWFRAVQTFIKEQGEVPPPPPPPEENCNDIIVERDNLIVERDNLIVERDNLIVERDSLVTRVIDARLALNPVLDILNIHPR